MKNFLVLFLNFAYKMINIKKIVAFLVVWADIFQVLNGIQVSRVFKNSIATIDHGLLYEIIKKIKNILFEIL